jgi:hypothetical protein
MFLLGTAFWGAVGVLDMRIRGCGEESVGVGRERRFGRAVSDC